MDLVANHDKACETVHEQEVYPDVSEQPRTGLASTWKPSLVLSYISHFFYPPGALQN